MEFTLTQLLLTIFLIFALSRVILRYKGGNIAVIGMLFWIIIFLSAILFVLFPSLSSFIAHRMGITRGVDAIVYTSVVVLFYLVFRLHVNLQNMKHEMTKLVEKLALTQSEKKTNEKSSKN